jgi:hypothetical protein
MNNTTVRLWTTRIAFAVVFISMGILLSYGAFLYWVTAYPDAWDPKNIDYVLWKHGLNRNMNLDDALSGMTHDTWAVDRVQGLSKDQLRAKFGVVRSLSDARPYDQLCVSPETVGELGTHTTGKEFVFLRDSDWMVILDKGKAVDLVLCKGY